jgi:hypothetical protein
MLIWTFFLVLVCGTSAQNLSVPFTYILYIICIPIYTEEVIYVVKGKYIPVTTSNFVWGEGGEKLEFPLKPKRNHIKLVAQMYSDF